MKIWKRSTFGASDTCVEIASDDTHVLVRNSRDPDGPVLQYTPAEWEAFIAGVKNDEFDLPA